MAEIKEEIDLSLTLENHQREISVCLLPDLTVSCIMGMDFLCAFSIELDFRNCEWSFSNHPHRRYVFELGGANGLPPGSAYACCELSNLAPDQENLGEFLANPHRSPSRIPVSPLLPNIDVSIRLLCNGVSFLESAGSDPREGR